MTAQPDELGATIGAAVRLIGALVLLWFVVSVLIIPLIQEEILHRRNRDVADDRDLRLWRKRMWKKRR